MKLAHVAAVALALALVACKPSAKSESSQTTTTSASTSTKAGLVDLESKMVKGKALGSNASEKKIAGAIQEILGEDGESDWAAVVKVNETASPKKVVLLVRLDDLRGAKKGDRKEILDLFAALVDDEVGPGSDLAIGIKGKIFFGAIATRTGKGTLKKSTGSVVDTKPLEGAIAAL